MKLKSGTKSKAVVIFGIQQEAVKHLQALKRHN